MNKQRLVILAIVFIAVVGLAYQFGLSRGFHSVYNNLDRYTETKIVEVPKVIEVPGEAVVVYKEGLRQATRSEIVAFLAKDTTDEITYDGMTFNCANYSAKVQANAKSAGLKCAYVELQYNIAAHAIVAFDSLDAGLIFVEPEEDWLLDDIKVGTDYEEIYNEAAERYGYYVSPTIDDYIVVNMIIVW